MDTRTGWAPVCGAVLLCILSILSIRAWQGADLATDFRGLASNFSIDAVDRELAQFRDDLRSGFGLDKQKSFPELPAQPAAFLGDFETNNAGVACSDALELPRDIRDSLDSLKRSRHLMKTVAFNRTVDAVVTEVPSKMDRWFEDAVSAFAGVPRFVSTTNGSTNKQPANAAEETRSQENVNSLATESGPEVTTPAWVLPKALIAELDAIQAHPMASSWAQSTIQVIEGLQKVQGVSDPDSTIVFEQLRRQLNQLDILAAQVSPRSATTAAYEQGELVSLLQQTRYSIQRRLEVWPVVHELAKRQVSRIGLVESYHVGQFLLASRAKLNTSAVEKGWADYLQLSHAASVFNSLNPNRYEQKKAARVVLSRLNNPSLSNVQKQYLRTAVDEQTIEILKTAATDLVDMERFLKRLEKLELNDSGATQFYLNDSYQSLLWSGDQDYQLLAQKLQTHYRNANFRVAIDEKLLNRMIPELPDTREPYRDFIQGARVVGQSRISNQLRISLIPDPNQISMKLATYGKVDSRTTATRSGVVVQNEGVSRFRIIKRLALGQHGIFAYRSETTSQMAQRVVGLRTNLDKIPPLGWIVRRIAKNKIEQQAPATKRYAQNQLENKAETRFDQEVEQKLDDLETMLTDNLLHPLVAMDLEPAPVEISTTENQIIMRYRLAGRDQMAASTARPQASPSCLMSMQIHESAINNLVNRFDLAGKKFTTEELIVYINQVFGRELIAQDEKTQKPAEFEFAPFDPFRLQFEEGKITIAFNLKSFKIGKGKRWKNLNITATYDPQINQGFQLGLTQGAGGLRIKGRRLNIGDQIAIGIICEVLFPKQFEVAMMPSEMGQKLQVSALQATQFVVSNGWIGLSVDDVSQTTNDKPFNQAKRKRPFLNQLRR